MLRKLNYGAAKEGQREATKVKEKSGGKSRSVSETGSKLSNKQEEAAIKHKSKHQKRKQ